MFSCEFCEISKNTFFTEHLRTVAGSKWLTKWKFIRFLVKQETKYLDYLLFAFAFLTFRSDFIFIWLENVSISIKTFQFMILITKNRQ